jgi:hypothetical protein
MTALLQTYWSKAAQKSFFFVKQAVTIYLMPTPNANEIDA